MKSMRMSLMCLLAFIATLSHTFAEPLTIKAGEETIQLETDDRQWTLGFEDHQTDQGILEYVLPGEVVENWSELVTINYYKGLQGPEIMDKFVSSMEGGIRSQCQDVTWTPLSKAEGSVSYEWTVKNCQGNPDQSETARVIQGEKGLYVLHYASKTVPIPEEKRSVWQKNLSSAQVS